MADQPNVVLVVADTTRADDASDRRVAPTLSELGSAGTTASRAFAPAPWTLPSHASLLTGAYPSKHGAHADHERLDDELPTLAEVFRSAGYETVGVSNNTWISAEGGFDRGFDTFRQMWQLVQSDAALGEIVEVNDESRVAAVAREVMDGNPFVNAANVLYRLLVRDSRRSDDGAKRTTGWIADWLDDRDDDRPFFLFVNFLEPHLEYRPPEEYAERHLPDDVGYEEALDVPQEPYEYLAGHVSMSERDFEVLRGLYRAEIEYVDAQIGALRDALDEAGEWEDTVFLVTGDHGENIGDHGMMDHQYCLYDTLIHVPLVATGGSFTDGGTLSDLVSLVDVPPTLLDEAGIDAPDAREAFQGRSFHPDADVDAREYVVSEYMAPQPTMDALERHVGDIPDRVYQYDRSLRAIRTAERKLVRGSDGSTELYDLQVDPSERVDVADAAPDEVVDLESTLDEWLAAFEHADVDGSVTIDDEREAQLERLGYLR